MKFISYGGGVQSTAMLVLAAQGALGDVTAALFANVGDRSEHPETLAYVRKVAVPFAAEAGIDLRELRRVKRDGQVEDLHDRLMAGRTAIPVRRTKDGPPMSRSCTADFKVAVISKELKRHGATRDHPVDVCIGISVDEIERAKPGIDPRSPFQRRVYPLLDLGLHRSDCRRIIADAGLPVPPKSACWFCPFHDREAWRTLKRKHPDLFTEAERIETVLTEKATDGRPVFLTRHGVPLGRTIDDQIQLDGFGDDPGCDSGWCMT